MKTAEEILAEAARLVERGWCQNALEDSRGRLCIVGALRVASGQLAVGAGWTPACLQAREAVCKEIESDRLLAPWNNEPGRTAEEVATALRNAKRWLP